MRTTIPVYKKRGTHGGFKLKEHIEKNERVHHANFIASRSSSSEAHRSLIEATFGPVVPPIVPKV